MKQEKISEYVKDYTDNVELNKTIDSFEEVFMINPFSDKSSLKKCMKIIQDIEYDKEIYPSEL